MRCRCATSMGPASTAPSCRCSARNSPTSMSLGELAVVDGVAVTLRSNAATLADALRVASTVDARAHGQIEWAGFDRGKYNPTPTIVDAARELYAGHSVAAIGRRDAEGEAIGRTLGRLREIAAGVRREGTRRICFVTGTPGAGKTLLGLDLAFRRGASDGPLSAMLSSNRTLVHVLREALAADTAKEIGSKAEARRRAQASIQELMGFLFEHLDPADGAPPERVLVYDEAQRAWDEETGKEKMDRARSEPALLLDILSRAPSSCLVCLVGPGQEINSGEGGLALWGEALTDAWKRGTDWRVYASPVALGREPGLVGAPFLADLPELPSKVEEDTRLHLSAGVRSYRNSDHGRWVEALLRGDAKRATVISDSMPTPPARVTRSLPSMKSWLRARCRGGRRVGLLGSSAALGRLRAEGVLPSPRSRDLDAVSHWFLKELPDFRSSNALEVPLSEFVCQGLEVDYAGICWGGDLVLEAGEWTPRRMSAPNWYRVKDEGRRAFRMNAYRVLLTRAREGLAIFVPTGCWGDPTRRPAELDEVYRMLVACGCVPMAGV